MILILLTDWKGLPSQAPKLFSIVNKREQRKRQKIVQVFGRLLATGGGVKLFWAIFERSE